MIIADSVDLFTHRLQAGTGRADAGQKSDDSKNNYNPHAKRKATLQIDAQHQKQAGGKQARKTKLTHPSQ